MKVWIALPIGFENRPQPYGFISNGATCPPTTLEMVQDNMHWYEAEILRRMPTIPADERARRACEG